MQFLNNNMSYILRHKQHKFTSISQRITSTDLKTAVIKLNKLSNLTPRKLANIPWYHHVVQNTKSERSNG